MSKSQMRLSDEILHCKRVRKGWEAERLLLQTKA
jgi:hypothetical protein